MIETPLSKVEKPPKQAFPSAFVLFKNEQIQKLKQTNLNSKIDKKFGVDAWGELSEEGKKVYHTQAAVEKEKLDGNYRKNIKLKSRSIAEKKESKKLSNRKYQNCLHEERILRENRVTKCKLKSREILIKRIDKLNQLKDRNDILSSEMAKVKVEETITNKVLEEKAADISNLKEKYAVLYKTHKHCKKS